MMAQQLKETTKFRVKSANAKDWKSIVSAVETLMEEANFTVDKDGFKFRAMDPSHIAMIDVKWSPKSFESFQCEKSDSFGLRLEDFRKLIDRAGNDSFEISREDKQELIIREGQNREFQLHLVDADVRDSPLPKLNLDSRFVLDSDQFDSIMKDVAAISNHIKISTEGNKLIFEGRSDQGKARVELEQKEKFTNPASSTYSLEYLQKLCKHFSGEIKFAFSSKMPLKISFLEGVLDLFLAPRVSE